MKPEELAPLLYSRYCEAVGGKAFNGDLLPTWGEFVADPAKKKQAEAWLAVASEAIKQIGTSKELKSLMNVWRQANDLQLSISGEIHRLEIQE